MSAVPISLQIGNAAACEKWVGSLPVVNELVAHQKLADQIDALSTTEITALERLRVLEALKETVDLLQAVVAKHYAGKALPLDKADADAWQSVVMLWWALGTNYRCCLDAYIEGDASITQFGPLANLRCLQMTRNMMLDYYRIYRQPDPTIWQEFNELFGIAEKHKISHVRVRDTFVRKDPECSCVEIYVHGLLTNLANPYSLTARAMGFMYRWVHNWAPLVGLSVPPLPAAPHSLIAVDFTAEGPSILSDHIPRTPGIRYLNVEQLSHTMRTAIGLLKKGNTPAQLGLGADARQPGCENLLMLLYVRWCRSEQVRDEIRSPADDPGKVCFGMSDVHGLVSSKASNAITDASPPEKIVQEEPDAITRYFRAMRQTPIYRSETWQILNHSASGFMCLLRDSAGTIRFSHNQLAAVERIGDKSCRIGIVQWLRANENNEFRFGFRLFPGAPDAVMVKPSNFKLSDRQDFEPALLLPEVAAPASAATLLLPVGWFQRGRIIEFKEGPNKTATLINLVESNDDFERCTFIYSEPR